MSYEKQGFASGDVLYATQLNAMDDQIADNEEEITGLKSAFNDIAPGVDQSVFTEDYSPAMTANHFWNIEGARAVYTEINTKFFANQTPISVNPGETWKVVGYQGNSHKLRIWAITDADYNILSMAPDYYDTEEHTSYFTVPNSGVYLITSRYGSKRNFYIGKTYNAVERCLKQAIVGEASLTIPAFTSNTYWNIEGEKAVSTYVPGNWRAYDPIEVSEGDVYRIGAAQGMTHKARIWTVIDDSFNIIALADDLYNLPYNESLCIVPTGGTKIVITARIDSDPVVTLVAVSPQIKFTQQNLSETEKEQARQNIDAVQTSELNIQSRMTSFSLRGQYFWNVESGIAVLTPLSGKSWMASSEVSVKAGESYTVSGDQGATHRTRIWVVTDDEMNILAMANDYYNIEDWRTETFIVPQGGTKLVMTTRTNVGSPYVYLYKNTTLKDAIQNKILDGKTVAVIGDSISTNGNTGADPNVCEIEVSTEDVGKSLSAYLTYYDVQAGLSLGDHTFTSDEIGNEVTFTPTGEDVGKKIGLPNNYNPNSTTVWWEQMQTVLGNTTIPVCWSGSSVTSHEASQTTRKTAHAWHPAQIRKCGIRTPGTMDRTAPDMIIIYRGTNDFSHEPYTKLTPGYFDGASWEYPEDDTVTGGYGYLEGLALTIKKLREAYPDTQIYLCTLNVFKRINYSHFPTNNGLNTLPEYNNAIREAANFFGCGLIEFDKDGITFENCYSGGYITDSATIPTHPSDKGHAVMGRKAIADIKAQYNEL